MRALVLGSAMLLCVSALFLHAEDQTDAKTVTLKGMIVCTKCLLKETTDCGNAIKTQINGKDVVVYIDDKGKKEKYHGKVCKTPAAGSVTGTLFEKDQKTYIKAAADGVKFD